jgi:glutathione S-transferase
MKLHTFPQAPSPRRVHLFLAEKGLEIEQEIVDMRKAEHMSDEFAAIHPDCTLPVLELDDGTCLSSCAAICRHLESVQPDPPLLGSSPEECARIDDRDRWIEMNGLLAVMEGFRNVAPRMKDHALPGRRPVVQIPELADRGRERFRWFLEDLDSMLAKTEYVAGEAFSVADITALVTVDFAQWGLKVPRPDELTHLARWYRAVSQRPAIKACD